MSEIERLEARKSEIFDLYGSSGFFERTTKQDVALIEQEQVTLSLPFPIPFALSFSQ